MMKWGNEKKHKPFSFTSNIDGHWLDAGMPVESVAECHGNAARAVIFARALTDIRVSVYFVCLFVCLSNRIDSLLAMS